MPPRRRGRNAVVSSSESEQEIEVESVNISNESSGEDEIAVTQRGRNVRARIPEQAYSQSREPSSVDTSASLVREMTIFEESIKSTMSDAFTLGLDLADAGMINQVSKSCLSTFHLFFS